MKRRCRARVCVYLFGGSKVFGIVLRNCLIENSNLLESRGSWGVDHIKENQCSASFQVLVPHGARLFTRAVRTFVFAYCMVGTCFFTLPQHMFYLILLVGPEYPGT